MPRPKKEEGNKLVEGEKIDTAILILASVSEKLDKIFDKLERSFTGTISSVSQETPTAPQIPTEPTIRVPVPMEYKQIVHELLNQDFDIQVVPLSDSPAFQMTVTVPDRYAHLSDEYRKMYGKDIRAKVVTYSEGVVGVRAYVEKIWSSFNPTIQAQIASDRLP